MKTLDRYILRQLIGVTFLGVLSLTTLLLLGQIFKELQSLLVDSGAPPSIVIDFMLQVIPFSLTFSVPWGFLTAVLLVYGRLAADNELTSMRMSGLNLWRLSAPAIGLGLVLSALCYYINIEVAPKGKQAMTDLVTDAAMSNPRNLLQSGSNATRIDKIHLYIQEREGDTIRGLSVYPMGVDDDSAVAEATEFDVMHAQEAIIGDYDEKARILHLTLINTRIQRTRDDNTEIPLIARMPLQLHIPTRSERRLKANRFTNSEIDDALERFDFVRGINLEKMDEFTQAIRRQPPYPGAAKIWNDAYAEARYYITRLDPKNEREFRTEGVKRASFSCACIVFSLIGVPLAITARRRDTSAGFALGIMVAALYFLALVFCEISRKSSGIAPYIILWLPNVLCVAYAIWQHQKAKYRG